MPKTSRILQALASLTLLASSGSALAEAPSAFLKKCAPCHGKDGTGAGAFKGKAFDFSKKTPSKPAFTKAVRAGKNPMPKFDPSKLSDADLDAIYAFVQTLKR